ncbi:MAG: hypothetical protein AAF515_01585 [Pseudomonadota bacterium]
MDSIRLYGNDHSPWVQAVMLGLHDKQLTYTRTTAPPLDVFLTWGCMMPAARFDDAPWEWESKHILARIGFTEVSEHDMASVRQTWQGVLHRTDYWTRFWGEFSLASDPAPSAPRRFARNFLRSFTILYFFLLIRLTVFFRRPPDPENYGDQYLLWEERLARLDSPFLGGDQPDSVDLLLFGVVQCHCSIPVPPLQALQADPRLAHLRNWISRMQAHFADYPSLYSGTYFQPHSAPPAPAGSLDQLAFWLGSILMISLFWITIPLIAFLAYRNRVIRHAV